MRNEIGNLLMTLRKENKYTQNQLCKGLYSVSSYAKIESGESVPGYFELDYLFGRLGKSTERLEYVLPLEIYELYELQYFVQRAICHREFEKAENLLDQYEKHKLAQKPIHRQYICQMRAQILWFLYVEGRSDDIERILRLLHEAIIQTMDAENQVTTGDALSAEELKLILFRWEVSQKSANVRKEKELMEILRHIRHHIYDEEELVKVYPYAVMLLVEQGKVEEYASYCYHTRTAIEVLRNTGRIHGMIELIDAYIYLLKISETGKNEDIKNWESQRKSLCQVLEEADIHLSNYRLFRTWNRDFRLDYELIRQERLAGGMVQAELAEGICEPETLSRIEQGKRKPNSKNMNSMLKKLHRDRMRISMMLVTEQYRILELEAKISDYTAKEAYKKAYELIEELEKCLDMNSKRNQQYIGRKKLMSMHYLGKIDDENYRIQLEKMLLLTLAEKNDILESNLTETEYVLLNLIACLYEKNTKVEIAFRIWGKLIEGFENSRVHHVFQIKMWELMIANYSGTLEEYGFVNEAMSFCPKWAETILSAGKGMQLGRLASTEACIFEKQNDERYIAKFRQTLDLFKLMKNTYRYKCNWEYLEEKGILEKIFS